jgi:GNAT superfamily N-acetyltransferase
MPDVLIREARLEDCHALAHVIISATVDAFRGRVPDACLGWLSIGESERNWARIFTPGEILDQGSRLIVAESGVDGVIGLALVGRTTAVHANDPRVLDRYPNDLHSLQVSPEWQGKGVGRRLVSRVAELLVEQGETGLLVRVLPENPNVGFYGHLGAVRVGSQPYVWEGYATEELLFGWDDVSKLGR